MFLAKETDGGRGTSFSVKTMRTPPANVMDRVGSGVGGSDVDVGSEAVDDAVEIEIGIGAWGTNEAASVAAALVFSAIFQSGRGSWARLNDEAEGSSMMKLLGAGRTPKKVEGGRLEGADMC